MKKIMIATESEVVSGQLQEQLSQLYCVLVCHNGLDAAELLLEQNPDVLVVDLRLPGIDGVTLLQMARDSGIRVQTIVLADYLSNHIAWILERLEIASVLRYDSSVHCITARVLELLQDAKYEEPRMQIQRTLALLGFKLNTTGYRITEQAIYCYWENPGQQVTRQLYPLVAVLCSGAASQVEKAIRSSVETAWKNGDRQVWKMYFGADKNGKPNRPSNGDFLARISRCIMLERQERKNA